MPDFLVGGEQDLQGAVADLRVAGQDRHRIHDLGDAGLVVGAEQSGAVGGDDVVADLVAQRRIVGHADHLRGVGRQGDVATLVVAHDLRLDVLAGHVRRGVHVGAKADHRHRLVGGRRNRGVDIAVVVEVRVRDADLTQLPHQQAAEILLLFGRRIGVGGVRRLGVDGDVAQKALGDAV
jgi:hypothetical protein